MLEFKSFLNKNMTVDQRLQHRSTQMIIGDSSPIMPLRISDRDTSCRDEEMNCKPRAETRSIDCYLSSSIRPASSATILSPSEMAFGMDSDSSTNSGIASPTPLKVMVPSSTSWGTSVGICTTESSYPQQQMQCIQFPWKLHEMLETAEVEGFDSIVSWLPDQRSFKVHKPEVFTKTIMQRYFKQTKYKSFRRQINMWGFERIKEGAGKGGYFNPNFIRGMPSRCCQMKRLKVKGAVIGLSSPGGDAARAANSGGHNTYRVGNKNEENNTKESTDKLSLSIALPSQHSTTTSHYKEEEEEDDEKRMMMTAPNATQQDFAQTSSWFRDHESLLLTFAREQVICITNQDAQRNSTKSFYFSDATMRAAPAGASTTNGDAESRAFPRNVTSRLPTTTSGILVGDDKGRGESTEENNFSRDDIIEELIFTFQNQETRGRENAAGVVGAGGMTSCDHPHQNENIPQRSLHGEPMRSVNTITMQHQYSISGLLNPFQQLNHYPQQEYSAINQHSSELRDNRRYGDDTMETINEDYFILAV